MLTQIKIYLTAACIIAAVVFGSLFFITKNKLNTVKENLTEAQTEITNMKKFYMQREKDNKKIQAKYEQIIAKLQSDECGNQSVPQYIYDAIKDLEGK